MNDVRGLLLILKFITTGSRVQATPALALAALQTQSSPIHLQVQTQAQTRGSNSYKLCHLFHLVYLSLYCSDSDIEDDRIVSNSPGSSNSEPTQSPSGSNSR